MNKKLPLLSVDPYSFSQRHFSFSKFPITVPSLPFQMFASREIVPLHSCIFFALINSQKVISWSDLLASFLPQCSQQQGALLPFKGLVSWLEVKGQAIPWKSWKKRKKNLVWVFMVLAAFLSWLECVLCDYLSTDSLLCFILFFVAFLCDRLQ